MRRIRTASKSIIPIIIFALPLFFSGPGALAQSVDDDLFLMLSGVMGKARTGSTARITDPEESDIMEVSFEDGTRRIPVNQIILMFDRDVSQNTAWATVNRMVREQSASGLRVAGQIPGLGIYQLEITNDRTEPDEAVAALDEVISALEAYDGVNTASYNELLETRIAENDDDNSGIYGTNRAAYSVLDYYQAIPVFDHIGRYISFHDVMVAVIDSGIDLDTGQFDDLQSRSGGLIYIDPAVPGSRPGDWDPVRHGTATASIIGADNDDGIMNGLALRILGDRLSLAVVGLFLGVPTTTARAIAGAELAIARGARIINLSVGRNAGGGTPRWLINLQNQFTRLFDAHPEVLFVASASNDRLVLNSNDAPAGLASVNLITVGGLSSTNLEAVYSESATGPGIDIAAPATGVPVCCLRVLTSYYLYFAHGNSLATAFVSAIAAIVLSVDPSMTGAQLKDFLTSEDNCYPAPAQVGGVRPALLRTVGNAILQRTATSGSVDEVMDRVESPDNRADPPGAMINQLVSEARFSVSGPAYNVEHTIGLGQSDVDAGRSLESNYITGGQVESWFYYLPDEIRMNTDSFRLGSFSVGAGGYLIMAAGAPEGDYFGTGEAGTITFNDCEITTRSWPLDHYTLGMGRDDVVWIEVTGQLTGATFTGAYNTDPSTPITYTAEGEFTMAFGLSGITEATENYLEEKCLGGYQYAPPEDKGLETRGLVP